MAESWAQAKEAQEAETDKAKSTAEVDQAGANATAKAATDAEADAKASAAAVANEKQGTEATALPAKVVARSESGGLAGNVGVAVGAGGEVPDLQCKGTPLLPTDVLFGHEESANQAAERARHIWYLPGSGKTPNGSLKASEKAGNLKRRQLKGGSSVKSKKGPTTIFATPVTGAPEGLSGTVLTWKCPKEDKVAKKSLPKLHSQNAWDVATAKRDLRIGVHFDIDLGGERAIIAFSTQGAPPPTRQYPEILSNGCVEDDLYDADLEDKPVWTVVDTGQKELLRHQKQLRWTTKYKLQYRPDAGQYKRHASHATFA